MICHYAYKSCDRKHCDGEDIMFLICHMTSREHMFEGLCEFMSGSPSRFVTMLPMFGGCWSSSMSGELTKLRD